MTICSVDTVGSNVTGLSYAEEACLKILPSVAAGDLTDPIWRGLEPNSYSDFGGDLTTVARQPISVSRQRSKGTVTDLQASGGFNSDLTQTNLVRLMQGFFFNNIAEKPTTQPMNAVHVAVTSIASSDNSFNAASGLDVFKNGHIVLVSGFTAANNGVRHVTSVAAGKIIVSGTALTDESSPSGLGKIEVVGFKFPTGDLTLVASATAATLEIDGGGWTALGVHVGEWIFIGGDAAGSSYPTASSTNRPGYGRISVVTNNIITLNDTTFDPQSDVGNSQAIEVYFGSVLKNGNITRSYQLERTLGEDENGTQAQYIIGAVANELTVNFPSANKVNADLRFIALDDDTRTGSEGIKAGARLDAPGEDAINTSLDIYRIRMAILDPTEMNNDALFGFVSAATLTVTNNASSNKALGHLGGFGVSVGNFDAGGSITAYFQTIEALRAIRRNADISLNYILAAANAGFIFDMPLLGVSGGKLNIALNSPIEIPLTSSGAKNVNGYTLLANWFPYLPNAAMPV